MVCLIVSYSLLIILLIFFIPSNMPVILYSLSDISNIWVTYESESMVQLICSFLLMEVVSCIYCDLGFIDGYYGNRGHHTWFFFGYYDSEHMFFRTLSMEILHPRLGISFSRDFHVSFRWAHIMLKFQLVVVHTGQVVWILAPSLRGDQLGIMSWCFMQGFPPQIPTVSVSRFCLLACLSLNPKF